MSPSLFLSVYDTIGLTKYAPSGYPVWKTCVLLLKKTGGIGLPSASTPRSSRLLVFQDPLAATSSFTSRRSSTAIRACTSSP